MIRSSFVWLLLACALVAPANATLTRTQEIAVNSGASIGTAAFTTAAFTPENNSLVIAKVCGIQEGDTGMEGSDLVISDSVPLTWTPRATTVTSPAWSYGCRDWTAPVVTGVSMTVTIDTDASNFDMEFYSVEIFSYTTDVGGATVTAGATAVGSDADGDGAASITLSGAPATSSHVLAMCMTGLGGASGTITSGAGFTQVNERVQTSWSMTETETRTGSTSTTVDWVDVLATGTGFGGAVMTATEIAETGGGGASVVPIILQQH